MVQASAFIVAPSFLDSCFPKEFFLDSLGQVPLEARSMGGLQDSMCLVLSLLAVTEKSQVVCGRFEPHH